MNDEETLKAILDTLQGIKAALDRSVQYSDGEIMEEFARAMPRCECRNLSVGNYCGDHRSGWTEVCEKHVTPRMYVRLHPWAEAARKYNAMRPAKQ